MYCMVGYFFTVINLNNILYMYNIINNDHTVHGAVLAYSTEQNGTEQNNVHGTLQYKTRNGNATFNTLVLLTMKH